MSRRVTAEQVAAFRRHLREDEREPATIRKYLHNVADFAAWLGWGSPSTRKQVIQWKDHLQHSGQQPVTVNGKLSALNRFFAFLGWSDCRVKHLRIQRRMFRSRERELTKQEYVRLLETAQGLGRERLALLMEAMCATGYGYPRCGTSRWRPPRRARPPSPSRANCGPSCCRGSSAGSCKSTPKSKKSSPARYSSPETEKG